MKDWFIVGVAVLIVGIIGVVFMRGAAEVDRLKAMTKAQQEMCHPYVVLGSYELDVRYFVVCGDGKQYEY